MRQKNNPSLPIHTFILCALFANACGISKKPHYDDQGKTFGRAPTADELPINEEPPTGPRSPEVEEPTVPPDQLLSHYGFSGYFNMDTVHRIERGSDEINGQISQGGLYDSMLSQFLSSIIGEPKKESLEMIVRQNGDGKNLVTQKVETNGGDSLASMKGDSTQSGTQFIDWILASDKKATTCPHGFVCIGRMVWVPVSGETLTYCYRDLETKAPITIPYSPNTQFGADSLANAIGNGVESSPFEVSVHSGNVSCDDRNTVVRDRRLVIYKISQGNLSDAGRDGFLRKATHRSLNSDMEVSIQYSLYHSSRKQPYLPKEGPYIDQLTRLNSQMKFFLNTSEHVMVKLERTVQSPLKLEGSQIADAIRETYGDAAAYLAELLFPKDGDTMGAQLIYSFEFCTHLGVIENPFNHCTGTITQPLFLQSRR